MTTIIKNKKELEIFIENNGDYETETNYMAQDRETGECFAITGSTYASEAFRCVNNTFQLVISDDKYYEKEIEKQLSSKFPDMNPFYIRDQDNKSDSE